MELALIPLTPSLRRAYAESRAAFANRLGVTVPESWPVFPAALSRSAADRPPPWSSYIFVIEGRWLVGNGGFKSEPNEEGEVEIGYEIAPAFRGCGYASEAARRFIRLAFDHGARSVVAHSEPRTNASNAVMLRVGMRLVGILPHPELGAIWRYRITAPGVQAIPRSATGA